MAITTKTAAALIHNANPEPEGAHLPSGFVTLETGETIGYKPENDPFYNDLQNAVNADIQLRAAQREIEQLKTFLKEHDLLTAFQDWKTEQDAEQNQE